MLKDRVQPDIVFLDNAKGDMAKKYLDLMKPDFMDEECPKGGKHKPILMNDNYQFKCEKCGKLE